MSKKLPYKYQLLSIFVAGLLVGGVILYIQLVILAHNPDGASQDLPIVKITGINQEVRIAKPMTECMGDDQCIVVDTTCSFCCNYVAINSKYEQAFNQRFDQSCASYKGSTCECFDLSSYPKCVNQKCELVEWKETANDIHRPIQ